jgi:PKD repeat protein
MGRVLKVLALAVALAFLAVSCEQAPTESPVTSEISFSETSGGDPNTVAPSTEGASVLSATASSSSSTGKHILIYGPSMSPATSAMPHNEKTLAEAEGHTVTVVDATTWAGMTTEQFGSYNAIVFGDPTCRTNTAGLAAAEANKATWSAAVTGPMYVQGSDPRYHTFHKPESLQMIRSGINFVVSGSGTGLYASLSCYYYDATPNTPVNFLSEIGDFQVRGQWTGGSTDAITIVEPAHPAMAGLTNAGLSYWYVTIHEFLTAFPASFDVLATNNSGHVFIIATPAVPSPGPGPGDYWEMNDGEGIVHFSPPSPGHGHPSEYGYATVPAPSDLGWGPAPDPEIIAYSVTSTLCGVCDCLAGGQFTYFRRAFDIPADVVVTEFTIDTRNDKWNAVDDGIRVSIFNSAYPSGTVVAYQYLGIGGIVDLKSYAVSGETNTVIITHVDDCCSESNLLVARVTLDWTDPPVADPNGPYTGAEGASIPFDGTASSDPDGTIVTYDWNFGDGTILLDAGSTPSHEYADKGNYTVTLTVTDNDGASSAATTTANISNVAPTVGPITVDFNVVPVGTTINASADFTDPGWADTHTAVWDWNYNYGDTGTGTVTQGAGSGSVDDSHTYTATGLYTIQLTVTDDDGDSDTEVFEFVVVYDPSAGFVTGGGWIDSPWGAYKDDPDLVGKANFGFVAKYKKGADTPTGQTEFQFHVADLNFHSTSYDWLVVTGSDYAMSKGYGTINGAGDYRFMLWAGDKDPDTFRIRIWTEDEFGVETDYYDNDMDQAISGGSIVIHTKKK